MTVLVSSGCLKSDTPRTDRKQAAVVSCWNEGERESREKMEGGGWMRKERGEVEMSNGEGWDDRGRAHSDGAGVEWGLGTKQT